MGFYAISLFLCGPLVLMDLKVTHLNVINSIGLWYVHH